MLGHHVLIHPALLALMQLNMIGQSCPLPNQCNDTWPVRCWRVASFRRRPLRRYGRVHFLILEAGQTVDRVGKSTLGICPAKTLQSTALRASRVVHCQPASLTDSRLVGATNCWYYVLPLPKPEIGPGPGDNAHQLLYTLRFTTFFAPLYGLVRPYHFIHAN